jgi:RNA polymerase sigma-70 factor (ECF subfamily)
MADSPLRTFKDAPCPPDAQDALLIDRLASGDRSVFDRFVAEHQAWVAALVYRLLGWSADVEDVVQEVFLAALKGLPKFRGQARLKTWLTRIAINKCRTHRRHQFFRLRWLAADQPMPQLTSASPADEPTLDRESFERVHRAIRSLPIRYREVVMLRYLEELSIEAISEVLKTTPNTVHVRLHRARAQLRDRLAGLIEE